MRDLHITFVGKTATSAVIQWSTDANTLASQVWFGRDGGPLDTLAQGYSFSYGGGGARREHEVHLCGLEPGQRYRYRAGGTSASSSEYTFVTAPADGSPMRILVVGDARSDPATWRVVAAHALAERPDALLFTSDAVYDGASQSAWDAFFEAAPELLASTPGLWADGNHEGISEVYFAIFAFPDNGQPHRHEHWYSSTYGPLQVAGETLAARERDRTRKLLSEDEAFDSEVLIVEPLISRTRGRIHDRECPRAGGHGAVRQQASTRHWASISPTCAGAVLVEHPAETQ